MRKNNLPCGYCGESMERVLDRLAPYGWRWRHLDRALDKQHRPVTGDYGPFPGKPIEYADETH